MIRYTLSRIGCMMVIGGAISLVLGVAAERSGTPAFKLVAIGVGLVFFGLLLWNKLRSRKRRNTRFSRFRRQSVRDETDQHNRNRWDDGYDN